MNTATPFRTGLHNARELTWTLAWLRLCAVAGQALTVAVVAFGMRLSIPLTGLSVGIAALRMVLVYGPGVKGNMAELIRLARLPYPLPLAGLAGRRSLLSLDSLADAIVDCAYHRLRAFLELRHGSPTCISPGGAARPCGYSVLSLGKMGGRELNYSSDIDLMFLYEGNGETNGADPISNKEFFKKLSTMLTDLLSKHTSSSMCYRVDLRLRPEGTLGEVCVSLEGAQAYYQKRARDCFMCAGAARGVDPRAGRSQRRR